MNHDFQLVGLLTADPSLLNGPRSIAIDLGFKYSYPQLVGGSLRIDSTTMAPYILNIDGIPALHILALKILSDATLTVLVTSAAGTLQAWPVSGEIVWHSPKAADAITQVQLIGTAEVEYLAAG